MQTHVWIQDKVDMKAVAEHYNSTHNRMTVSWIGGIPLQMEGRYYGKPVKVYFYSRDSINNHLRSHLFGGSELQQVVFMESVIHEAAKFLLSRMRSKVAPTCPAIPPTESLMMYQCVDQCDGQVRIEYPVGDWEFGTKILSYEKKTVHDRRAYDIFINSIIEGAMF